MAPPVLVVVVGYTGGVGSALLAAMNKISLAPFALVRSTTMQFGAPGTCSEPQPVDFDVLVSRLLGEAAATGSVPVIADVTASASEQPNFFENEFSKSLTLKTLFLLSSKPCLKRVFDFSKISST